MNLFIWKSKWQDLFARLGILQNYVITNSESLKRNLIYTSPGQADTKQSPNRQ
jgi:hypothetical protein